MKSISNEINKLKKKLFQYNKNIETKIKNINKATHDISIPCTTKRVSQNSRIYIPYEIVIYNNLDLNKLNTHIKGICVGLNYIKYLEIINNDNDNDNENENENKNKNDNELDKYLINNIGSDNTVSCIIELKDRKLLSDFKETVKTNNWLPIKRKPNISKNINDGNDKWEGHYYYKLAGGEQETFTSWQGSEPQLFTTHKNFMTSDNLIEDVRLTLLYMILHLKDIDKILTQKETDNFKSIFENYLKEKKYCHKSCYDLILDLHCFNKHNYLISPILCCEISIDDFCIINKLNISHNVSVSKNIIHYCDYNQIMLSDYNPGNLFWDYKIANMRQQEDTIEEYWISIENSLKLKKDIYSST